MVINIGESILKDNTSAPFLVSSYIFFTKSLEESKHLRYYSIAFHGYWLIPPAEVNSHSGGTGVSHLAFQGGQLALSKFLTFVLLADESTF